MELAPSLGLCRRIVDLVESGNTLIANGLVEVEEICKVSTRLAVNRSFMKTNAKKIQVWIDNEAGVLARVVGLFSGRGYNIESLAVAQIDATKNISRITIITTGTPQVIDQIKLQLKKLVPVHKVADFKREDKKVICVDTT